MNEALRLYYGHLAPSLWKQQKWGLMWVSWFVFHLGPLAARVEAEPWEQPYVYAAF